MRILGRRAEGLVDAFLELFGEHVLQPVCLRVHGVEAKLERPCQVELEQPVVASISSASTSPRAREQHAPVGLVVDEPRAASFFTMAVADGGLTPMRRASVVVFTRSPSPWSL